MTSLRPLVTSLCLIVFFITLTIAIQSEPQEQLLDPIRDDPVPPPTVQTTFIPYSAVTTDYFLSTIGMSQYTSPQDAFTFDEKFSFTFGPNWFTLGFRQLSPCLTAQCGDQVIWTQCMTISPTPPENGFYGELLHNWDPLEVGSCADSQVVWFLKIGIAFQGTIPSKLDFEEMLTFAQEIIPPTIANNNNNNSNNNIKANQISTPITFTTAPPLGRGGMVYPTMVDKSGDQTAHFSFKLDRLAYHAASISFSFLGNGCLNSDPSYSKLNDLMEPYQSLVPAHSDSFQQPSQKIPELYTQSQSNNDIDDLATLVQSALLGQQHLQQQQEQQQSLDPAPSSISTQDDDRHYSCDQPGAQPARTFCLVNGSLLHVQVSNNHAKPDQVEEDEPLLYAPKYNITYPFHKNFDYEIKCFQSFIIFRQPVVLNPNPPTPSNMLHIALQPLDGPPQHPSTRPLDISPTKFPALTLQINTIPTSIHPASDVSAPRRPVVISPLMVPIGSVDQAILIMYHINLNGNDLDPLDTFSCTFNDGIDREYPQGPIHMGDILVNITTTQKFSEYDLSAYHRLFSTVLKTSDRAETPASFSFHFWRIPRQLLPILESFTITLQTSGSVVEALVGNPFQLNCQFIHENFSNQLQSNQQHQELIQYRQQQQQQQQQQQKQHLGSIHDLNNPTGTETPPLLVLSQKYTTVSVAETHILRQFGPAGSVAIIFEGKNLSPDTLSLPPTRNHGQNSLDQDEIELFSMLQLDATMGTDDNDLNNLTNDNPPQQVFATTLSEEQPTHQPLYQSKPIFSPTQVITGRSNFTIRTRDLDYTDFSLIRMYIFGNHRLGGGYTCTLESPNMPPRSRTFEASMTVQPFSYGLGLLDPLISKYRLPMYVSSLTTVEMADFQFWGNNSEQNEDDNVGQLSNNHPTQPSSYPTTVRNEIHCRSAFAIVQQSTQDFYLPSYFHFEGIRINPEDGREIRYSFGTDFTIDRAKEQDHNEAGAIPMGFKIYSIVSASLLCLLLIIALIAKLKSWYQHRQLISFLRNNQALGSSMSGDGSPFYRTGTQSAHNRAGAGNDLVVSNGMLLQQQAPNGRLGPQQIQRNLAEGRRYQLEDQKISALM